MHHEHGALPAMTSVVFQADTPWSIKDGLMMYHSLKAMHGIALMFIQVCVSYLEKCMSLLNITHFSQDAKHERIAYVMRA